MDKKTAAPGLEFSRPLPVDKITPSGTTKTVEANEDERRRLAARFGLPELKGLRAELEVNPARAGQAFAVTGHMTADAVQKCIVTLEPLPAHIETDIDMLYTIEAASPEDEEEIGPEDAEVETVKNGIIDLGELVAQHLGISLDPYPRKTGAAFTKPPPDPGSPAAPLAKLAEWKKKEQ